ncbi:hypothetical protein TVAG_260000 [Trichomonas vaginalis G3]|uniref:Uncharacterized protein n=1 Tax=Trichomonas vaginalis (strain ATCC PRA-98 / G3) TaxID=412133 RepID=A2E8T3_TRIV3|nr:hypothetical protein TVAGG3_0926860 [Trichomonas vaginalis G3]EAY10915.1 hypothetical protein TVAG_260000 [Trichomonas vaginalis G3]KAI5485546.1 hypothetical protein TVAGG3_0926860 [Trichomonas vaginalis G3]|eukprot:XP_001323138.1 hypothetical protein [Trichomonas vaginalis G3]
MKGSKNIKKEPKEIDVDEHAELYSARFDLIKSREALQQANFEKDELTKEILEKREQLRNYKGMITERNDLISEIQALQLQLKQSNEYADTLSNENIKLHREISALRSKVDSGSLLDKNQTEQFKNLQLKYQKKADKYHKLKTQFKIDQNQLEIHKNKLSSLTLDNDASNLKTELLIEEITTLKLELAEKDNDYVKMKHDTEQNLLKAQSALSTHQLLTNENELLQKQLAEIRRDKYNIDQEAIKLRVELENAKNRISEMELREESNKQTIAEEHQKRNEQAIKLTKYISASREMRSMIQDKDQTIGDLRAQISEQDNNLRQRRDEIANLKSSLADAYTAKTELAQTKQKLNELTLQAEAHKQKNDILQQSLDSQMQMNKNLSSEIISARKQAADLNSKHDNLKYEMSKQQSRYDTAMQTLQDQNSKLNKQVENYKKELQNQMEDYESKMLGQAAEYETKLKEQNDRLTGTINQQQEEFNAKLTDMDRRNQMQSRSLGDTFKKVNDLTNEVNELQKLKEDIAQLVPQNNPGKADLLADVKSLVDTKNAAVEQLKSVNKEMKAAKTKYEQFMHDVLKLPVYSSPPTSISLAKEITSALSAASEKVSNLQKEKDDLNSENEKKKSIFNSLQGIIGTTLATNTPNALPQNSTTKIEAISYEKIPEVLSQKVSQIQGENAKLMHIMNQAKSFVEFDLPENLPVALAKEKSDQMQLQHIISDKENEIKRINEVLQKEKENTEKYEKAKKDMLKQIDDIKQEKEEIEQQMNIIQKQVSAILPGATSFQALPQALTTINNELEAAKTNRETFIRDLCRAVHCDEPKETKILETIKNLTQKLANAEEGQQSIATVLGALTSGDQKQIVSQITQLQAKERSLENLKTELLKADPRATPETAPRIIKELKDNLQKEKEKRMSLVTQLGTVLGTKEEENLPIALNKLVQDLNQHVSMHTNFVDALGGIVKTTEEKEIPLAVKKVTEDFTAERYQHAQLLGQIGGLLNINSPDDNVIFNGVQSLVQELQKEKAKSLELERCHANFVDSLMKITGANDESAVPSATSSLKNALEQTQELINTIVAIVTHKNKKDVNFLLPLSPQVTATVTAALNDLVRKYDSLRSDADLVIKDGIEFGYTGSSVSECAKFITEQEVTKKAQEMHEDTFAKLKQVREENAKERELLEKRNQEANRKLAELRQQKIEQNEEALNKQAELRTEIGDLQKQMRKAASDVEAAQRLRFELVRLAAKEVYDIGTLKAGLTDSEIRRLQL